jgi:hypothetical protein
MVIANQLRAMTDAVFFNDVTAWAKRGCRWHGRWKKGEVADNKEAARLRR